MRDPVLAERIDLLLPQTQCTKCGYAGCRPYAQAVAAGDAEINRCPPGGAAAISRLAALLGRKPIPLDPDCGAERARTVALIDEARCIGCTLCIRACPVDAIVGAAKLMHTVITELCTGCDLCLPPCPVDCIAMVPPPAGETPWTRVMADAARARYELRKLRLARAHGERAARLSRGAQAKLQPGLQRAKQAVIRAALERAQARRAGAARTKTADVQAPVRPPAAAGEARRGAAKKR